jgi:ectoine hydroxylase-related dioxygenase (phytanoyl-CoA dioxygenase family)
VTSGKLDLIASRAPGRVEVYNAVRRDQLFRDFVFHSTAAEIAARIAGSQIARFYFDVTFCKIGADLPKAGSAATSLHHDVASLGFKGRQLPSLWLALTDVPPDAGPLVFALGSHTNTETLFRASGDYAESPAEGYRDHKDVMDFIAQERFEMKTFVATAGDVIIIHPYVLHGSAPVANGARRRLGFCTRWMGDDVTWRPSPYTLAEVRSMRRNLPVGSPPPSESFPVTWSRPC